MKKILFAAAMLLALASPSWATTRYVRTDGGTGTQCTGLANAAYPGSGTGQACAVNHPNWIFPPRSESVTRAAAAGDTVVIASGSYRIGCQNASTCRDANVNLTVSAFCDPSWAYDCYMGTVPSSTTVIGCTTTGCASQSSRPELWGAGRVTQVMSVAGKTGVTLKDIWLHDHATCGFNHSIYSCGTADSSELSALDGLRMVSSTNLTLTNFKITGMYRDGTYGGSVNGLLVNGNSEISYNSFAGVDLDSCNNNGTCGTTNGQPMTFGDVTNNNPNTMVQISWNGCVEDAANVGSVASQGCYNQSSGGYGDGLGSSTTSGNWILRYVKMLHNTSDGLDLLYCSTGSCTVNIRDSHFEGNAGNQVKFGGTWTVYNTLIGGDCDFFAGKSYTIASNFDNCRALGDVVVITFQSGTTGKFYGSTIINARGNIGFTLVARGQANCTSANTLDIQNSIISSSGRSAYLGGGTSAFSYKAADGDDGVVDGNGSCQASVITQINSNINGFGSNPAGTGNSFASPALSGVFDGSTIAALLAAGSPGRDTANETASGQPTTDFNAFARGASYDMGFLEYNSSYGGGSVCGNNIKETGETCDGTDLNSQTCVTQGFTSGTLTCHASCGSFVTSSCVTAVCGNSVIDSGEQCDGATLGGATCVSQGFSGGTLSCTSCAYNTSLCTTIACGDGHIDAGEECDDGNTTNSDGCSAICEIEVAGLEKLLLYTEADPSSNLTPKTHRIIASGITHSTDTSILKDFGASHFGNFTHRMKVTIDSCADNGAGEDGGMGIWAMSATSRASLYALENANDGLVFSLGCLSSAARYSWKLYSANNQQLASWDDAVPTIVRYVEITRSGTTLTAKLYSDANYTTLLHTLTVTATATAYRYLYTGYSYNDGVSGTSFSGQVANMNLDAAAPPALGCSATTTNNCTLSPTASASSSGTCTNTGSCSYLCTNGAWSQTSNTCVPPSSNQIISIELKGGSLIGITVH